MLITFNTTFSLSLKVFFYILLVVITCVANAEWQSEEKAIMGTTIRIELLHADSEVREKAIKRVFEEMDRINGLMSPYIEDSQLSIINRDAFKKPVKVDNDLFNVIEKSLEFSELTNGAFDITFASVGYLYDFRKKIRPSDEELNKAKKYINYKNIVIDKTQKTVSFLKPGVKIDLGGIAKGFAVDQSIKLLREMKIKHALVSAGGDTRLLGDRNGRPWLVAIRDPADKKEAIIMMPLQNEALSTSGDYERFFIEDGVRYHHIIHPSTGKSASTVRSASIIGPNALTTDALSTSIFVMGIKEGMHLLDTLENIEGVVIDHDGKMYYSKGLVKD